MKIVSWNLNGLMPSLKNNHLEPIQKLKPDIFCLQEIRTDQKPEILKGYNHYYYPAAQRGYAGTAIICKEKPLSVLYGMEGFKEEGRLIALEFDAFWLINVYVPNSQKNLSRKEYRRNWDQSFLEFVQTLYKPVIICGDFNTYRSSLDVFEENERIKGDEMEDEQANLEVLLEEAELIDVFRHLNPDKREYSWWAMRKNRRAVNRGWRIDYFLISQELLYKVQEMEYLKDIIGSDHCPVLLEISL